MRTAVDTSALLAIVLGESNAEAWLDLLARCRDEGDLICCEIVLAELAPVFGTHAAMDARLEDLGVRMLPCTAESAFLAGRIFAQYRRLGGPRSHLVPDFLIGAHASLQANRLLAADRGHLRRFFNRLAVLAPPAG